MKKEKNIDELEKLIRLYAIEFDCMHMNYHCMGLLLDEELVKASLNRYNIKKVYIYGGMYLGLQFYMQLKDKVDDIVIVDKRCSTKIALPGLTAINIAQFKEAYSGEYIIVTLLEYLDAIKADLGSFVPAEKMLLPGEFLGGL